ncbi:MAG: hypothetical protein M1839_001457 [Geoglossum umbratile]|nr:MAG: hypothetical protein M1839_001457 [Geoglossum umbratile]
MEDLKEQIGALKQRNFEGRRFVPTEALYGLLKKKTILLALQDGAVDVIDLEETTRIIVHGARKIFAILVTLEKPQFIRNFIAHDHYQAEILDHKLPLSEETLRSIIPSSAEVSTFYSKFCRRQWQYLVPAMHHSNIYRVLDRETILPYVESIKIGEGGYGIVHETTLLDRRKVVRKEFRAETSSSSILAEHRNLALLRHLKHPNIVELLNYYTYRGEHNFLFPLASQGDLAAFLSSKIRPTEFESEESLYVALSGLASALDKTHNFTSQTLQLDLIGLHHDLRPNNILVDGNKFILADFGLSRFKTKGMSSKTIFESGAGHYLAPECKDLEDLQSAIGRASDIWSFGCILTELLTYMDAGAGGVAEYKATRKVKEMGFITTYHFHGNATEKVRAWVRDLKPRLSSTGKRLLQLAEDMMALEPDARPLAAEVTRRLRYIALEAVYLSTNAHFNELFRKFKLSNLEAVVEYGRYAAWGWALQEMQTGGYENIPTSDHGFESVRETLFEVGDEAVRILQQADDVKSRLVLPLQILNDTLMQSLPPQLESIVRTQLELWMMGTEDAEELRKTRETFSNSLHYERIGMLAAIKHVSILSNNRSSFRGLDLDLKNKIRWESRNEDKSFNVGYLKLPTDDARKKVLVEWKVYGSQYVGKVGDELFLRVEALAELLHSVDESSGLRVLKCLGYFHDHLKHSFGLVYSFPASASSHSEPQALSQILANKKRNRDKRQWPHLEDRFKLAHRICVAVLEFHKVGWLHKNLTAHSIIFFRSSSVREPYIIGFNRSRKNDPYAVTEGPILDASAADYQHPKYLTNRQRFKPEYDYYSLGLILLEIGTWKPLGEMIRELQTLKSDGKTQKIDEKQKAIHDALRFEWVSILDQHMGTTYRKVVERCLDFGVSEDEADSGGVSLSSSVDFESLVNGPGENGVGADGDSFVAIELSPGANFARLVIRPLETCSLNLSKENWQ